jgi:hypothetical protein
MLFASSIKLTLSGANYKVQAKIEADYSSIVPLLSIFLYFALARGTLALSLSTIYLEDYLWEGKY